ncbi:putative diguanylate cyclase YcdT [Pseudidiomarina piscicola]|uniref:Putative diguanylate cyclase YcdT n=1 Tax=Pseudidiomarina piscicola TaxID=2614830 RepID=A0A6S6WMS4_9GAMM|nr:diguanylate cyclase [Pseudidiomarina piscicola]CAB0150691.1 putative diguanylate cyclase YcdT [Pseudidiomarina piscicola]VZT40199.1 putative diguanylate cyclase YcdT [Pseudomonas aeruginosa]
MRSKVSWLFSAVAIIYFVIAFYAADELQSLLESRASSLAKEKTLVSVSSAKSTLESSLYRDIYLGDSLATVITLNRQFAMDNWLDLGATLISKANNVRNVGVAPDDVISKNYPAAGNERAIGFNLRESATQYPSVLEARELQDVFLAGPFELVQGGKALAGRYPIFSDSPFNTNYWGTVSVIIDFDRLIESTGILDVQGATLAMRGVDGKGDEGEVFFGPAEVFNAPDFVTRVSIPNGEWVLAGNYTSVIPQALHSPYVLVKWTVFSALALVFLSAWFMWRGYRVHRLHAYQDELTGIANRRYAMRRLDELMSNERRSDFTVLSIDLNRFKRINDNLGHHAGDLLLQLVSDEIQRAIRGSDIVARMGGDEFLVLLHRLKDPVKVNKVIEKIREQVEHSSICINEQVIHPSLSIGFATKTKAITCVRELLKIADERMYEDKAQRSTH